MSPRIRGKPGKDNLYAKISFFLSLGFWIPLFNVGLCVASLIIAATALKRWKEKPEEFGGLGYIITAIILSISSIFFTVVGLVLFVLSDRICQSAICQAAGLQ